MSGYDYSYVHKLFPPPYYPTEVGRDGRVTLAPIGYPQSGPLPGIHSFNPPLCNFPPRYNPRNPAPQGPRRGPEVRLITWEVQDRYLSGQYDTSQNH